MFEHHTPREGVKKPTSFGHAVNGEGRDLLNLVVGLGGENKSPPAHN